MGAFAVTLGLCGAAVFAPPPVPVLTLPAAVCLVILLVAAVRPRSSAIPVLLLVLALLAGLGWGALRVAALTHSTFLGRVGGQVEMEVEVDGAERDAGPMARLPVRVLQVLSIPGNEGRGERLQLVVKRPAERPGATTTGEATAAPADPVADEGSILRVKGRLAAPQGPAQSGFDERTYLRRQGISCVLEVSAANIHAVGRRGGIRGVLDSVRRRALVDLGRSGWPLYSALLRGVVLGETRDIPDDITDAFRRSGTAHILSVSGLHVAGLASLILALGAALRLPRSFSLLLCLGAVVFFAGITGAGAPVVRAAVMLFLVMLAQASGRGRDPLHVLALAAAVVLAPNPLVVFSAGFQLSFAAVAGLVLLAQRIQRRLETFLPGPLASSMAISAAATVATAPISIAVFGQASLMGLVANLFIVPVITPVTGLGFASMLGGLLSPRVSAVLDQAAAMLLAWTVTMARLFARGPVLSRGQVGFALAAGAGVALAHVGRKAALRRQPGHAAGRVIRRAGPALLLLGACAGVLTYGAGAHAADALAGAVYAAGWPDTVEVRMLDVGEGNAALVRTPGRHAVLIDAGPEDAGVSGQLRALGVRRLDLVLITHPHADHFGGLAGVADSMPVGMLIDAVAAEGGAPAADTGVGAASGGAGPTAGTTRVGGRSPPLPPEAAAYYRVRNLLVARGTAYQQAVSGRTVQVDGVDIRLFCPAQALDPATGAWEGERINAASIAAVVTWDDLAILVPGDAEAAELTRRRVPAADVLFVPHHGSRDGVTPRLLAAIRPTLACISVGEGNTFGHPAPEILQVLDQAGVPTIRTDLSGWIALTRSGGGLSVRVAHGVTSAEEGSG